MTQRLNYCGSPSSPSLILFSLATSATHLNFSFPSSPTLFRTQSTYLTFSHLHSFNKRKPHQSSILNPQLQLSPNYF
ncbi:hypothetical protein VTL71DRAFT_10980 [Oculimacula yallundae]|uniref:Uncharacterized protein n=1 Tax=Oculimacula yallundae TaxID=86028 RepID=A0ABR4CX68_9HELO